MIKHNVIIIILTSFYYKQEEENNFYFLQSISEYYNEPPFYFYASKFALLETNIQESENIRFSSLNKLRINPLYIKVSEIITFFSNIAK